MVCLWPLVAWAAGTEPNEMFYVRTFAECPAFNGGNGSPGILIITELR